MELQGAGAVLGECVHFTSHAGSNLCTEHIFLCRNCNFSDTIWTKDMCTSLATCITISSTQSFHVSFFIMNSLTKLQHFLHNSCVKVTHDDQNGGFYVHVGWFAMKLWTLLCSSWSSATHKQHVMWVVWSYANTPPYHCPLSLALL